MTRFTASLAGALLATAMLAAPVLAETSTPTTPPATTTTTPPAAEPSTADKVKTRTKAEWAKLVLAWRKDKAKYSDCSTKTKADGLKGTKRLSAMYDCMTQ